MRHGEQVGPVPDTPPSGLVVGEAAALDVEGAHAASVCALLAPLPRTNSPVHATLPVAGR